MFHIYVMSDGVSEQGQINFTVTCQSQIRVQNEAGTNNASKWITYVYLILALQPLYFLARSKHAWSSDAIRGSASISLPAESVRKMSDWLEQYSAALTERDTREQAHKTYIDACTAAAILVGSLTTY